MNEEKQPASWLWIAMTYASRFSDWFVIAILVIAGFALGFVSAKHTAHKPKPAEVRYLSSDGTLLMTLHLAPGDVTTFDNLKSVTIITNGTGGKRNILVVDPSYGYTP